MVSNVHEELAFPVRSNFQEIALSGHFSSRIRAVSEVIIVPPLPWSAARAGKCYNNVQSKIKDRGGEPVFGWALTEFGPFRRSGWYPPPLYRRWLNHVVWRDTLGKLWEVTPNLNLDHGQESHFAQTEFLPDADATFEIVSDKDWRPRPCRYVPVRPEGETVAHFLQQAQHATNGEIRQQWIQHAILALQHQGFQPREWKLEIDGERTGSIWLIAE